MKRIEQLSVSNVAQIYIILPHQEHAKANVRTAEAIDFNLIGSVAGNQK
jgi:hypothetical protein